MSFGDKSKYYDFVLPIAFDQIAQHPTQLGVFQYINVIFVADFGPFKIGDQFPVCYFNMAMGEFVAMTQDITVVNGLKEAGRTHVKFQACFGNEGWAASADVACRLLYPPRNLK